MYRHASLNRAYRLLFNHAEGTCAVAPETARSAGKTGGVAASSPSALLQARLERLAFAMVLGLGLCAATPSAAQLSPPPAGALPAGGQVSAGSASLSTSGSTLTVGQASQRAIIHWSSFDVGSAAAVNFVQPNAAAVTLNRVTGGGASQIFGRVSANGQVYLVNPSGVLFGPSAQVDAGGLVASTLGISDADFLAGRDRFTQGAGEGASVVNQGRISVSPGGRIALLGTRVSNQGQLLTPGGDVALAAGRQVTLAAGADGHLQIGVEASELATLVSNGGLVQADGGSITLNAQGANALASAVVSNTGTLQARTVDSRSGRILLLADQGQGGRVEVGGTLDASAPAGGDGGFIETSAGHVQIADGARVSTLAAQGNTGTWLIDPTDFTIGAGSAAQTTSGIGASTLAANLASTSVTLQTAAGGTEPGDIHVNAPVSWNANTLTLNAANNIDINAVMTAGGTAGLALNYGGTNGNAAATPATGSNVNVALNGSGFTGRVDFTGTSNSLSINGTTYTLIKDVAGLQGIDSNRAGRYALANDIDANTPAGFSPIGAFSGTLDGMGHVIKNLNILRVGDNTGLLSQAEAGSMVRNIGLDGGYVLGGSSTGALAGLQASGSVISHAYSTADVAGNSNVGGLVGTHLGSISNAYVTGSVSGDENVGGLVGSQQSATGVLNNAYATGSVSGNLNVGGLVGSQNFSSISDVYATGSVTGMQNVGGLVGSQNRSEISNAYAAGSVSGGISSGGLIGGLIDGNAISAYWNIETTGQRRSAAGIGLTSAQIMTESSFRSWDLATQGGSTSVWRIYEGHTAPLLRSFLTPLTVTATTSGSKVYDGTATIENALYTTSGPVMVNPALVLGQARTAAKNVGTYSVDLGSLYSTQQGYDILVAPTVASFTITPKVVTGTITAAGKVYDGSTAAATSGTLSGAIAGDDVVLSSSGSFADRNVGADKTVTVSGRLDGVDGGNYMLDANATALASITRKALTGSITAADKIYDGTTAVTTSGTLTGVVASDNVSFATNGSFADRNAGTGKTVTVGGNLAGADAGNYTLDVNATATANILPKSLTGSITAADKVYDGTTAAATSGTFAGSIAGDSVTLSTSGSFADRHAGADKTVTVSGRLDGADAGNYTLDANATAIASILPKPLTGSITAADKVYDGTTAATTSGAFIGAITGDDVVLSSSGSFADRNVGAGKTVTVSGSLAGADAGNYTLDVNATTTAGITRKGLDGRIIAADKVYDGTTAATTSGALDGAIAGDDVNFSTSGSFADRHAGTGKTVTVGGNLAGSDAGNYFLQSSNADTTATITPRTLTGRITAADKVYDGTSAAVISGTLAGVIAGDDVTFSSSGSFADKSVGTGKTVNVSGSLAGADVGNYVLDPHATTTASIAPKPLTGRITAADKVYDGTTMAATSGSLAGAIAGDSVELISKGNFADSSAGTGKTVSVSARLSGADAGNYMLDANGTAIASITPASLVVTANDAIQPWTGRPFAGGHGVRYIGFVPGEDASVLGGALAYGGNAQGASLPGRYGLTVSGLASGNYDIQYHGGSLSIVAPEATPPAGELQRQTAPTAPVLGDISGALASRRSGVPLSIAADYIKVD